MLPNKRSAASESAQTLREGMWQLRYYYDITAGQCRQFWYGGCQFGNGQLNFFTDLQVGLSVQQKELMNQFRHVNHYAETIILKGKVKRSK